MMSSWRRRRGAAKNDKSGALELSIPKHFLCPISLQLMTDPVTLSTGATYDRHNIETWIESGNTSCPVTNQLLPNLDPIPNHAIRKIIQDWCVDNRSHGVQRIPTPRIPLSSSDVSQISAQIQDATQRKDGHRCRDLAAKLKESAKESDRNKRCFVSNGATRVLSAAFQAFSHADHQNAAVLAEILSAIITLTPLLDEDTTRNLSLSQIVWFMRFGNLSGRRDAVLALKSLLSLAQDDEVDDVAKIDGVLEALMKLIKEPICPTTTKASLLSIYYLVKPFDQSTNKKAIVARRLAEMGLVEMLVEMAVESERSMCEKALGVLDGMCSYGEVRERARENDLMIPVLVKKILRVSDMATEFAVSILWKVVVIREEEEEEEEEEETSVVVEAVGAGAFQKLLLVLQIGSSEVTKDKVSELLKRMNACRSRVECVDSLDFKHLKRPF